jgi:hypothetical protein
MDVGLTDMLAVEGGLILEPPPFPPQFVKINPQRITVTPRNAARLFCTFIPSKRNQV